MNDKKTTTRLDPGTLHHGIGSIGLGATDAEMLAMHDDPDHIAMLRKGLGHMTDDEFAAFMRLAEYELRRPLDAEEELEDDDEA